MDVNDEAAMSSLYHQVKSTVEEVSCPQGSAVCTSRVCPTQLRPCRWLQSMEELLALRATDAEAQVGGRMQKAVGRWSEVMGNL